MRSLTHLPSGREAVTHQGVGGTASAQPIHTHERWAGLSSLGSCSGQEVAQAVQCRVSNTRLWDGPGVDGGSLDHAGPGSRPAGMSVFGPVSPLMIRMNEMSRMALKKASNPGEVSGEEDKKERKETKTLARAGISFPVA